MKQKENDIFYFACAEIPGLELSALSYKFDLMNAAM